MTHITRLLSEGRRYCFVILPEVRDSRRGFRPCIVFENEPGYYPNGGGDVEPWYWGKDLAIAEQCARYQNAKLGLSDADVNKIVGSSMAA